MDTGRHSRHRYERKLSVFICVHLWFQLARIQPMSDIKPTVSKESTFDLLEIRLGRIISVELAVNAPKPSYVIRADFGKFGIRTSVGRFTRHSVDDLEGRQILGVLNFEPREIAGIASEFLCLGV